MKSSARMLAFGLAGSAAVALSGCGGSSSAPREPRAAALWSSAQRSVGRASSFHIDGVEPDNGLPVDLSLTRAGDMSGTIVLDGAKTDIIKVNGKVYIKLTPGILQQEHAPAGACAQACGRWIKLSASEASLLAGPYTMSSFSGAVDSSSLTKVTDAGSARIDGQPAWAVQEPDGAVVDLSRKSKHYPLEVKAPAGSHGVLEYSQWNAVPMPAAPPASQVVSLSSLR
jgi:hypothetical protein